MENEIQTLDLREVKVVAQMIVKKYIKQQQIDINNPIDVILPEVEHRILYNAFKGIKTINNIYNMDKALSISPTAFSGVTIINKNNNDKNIVTSNEPVIIKEDIKEDVQLNSGLCVKNTLFIYLNDVIVSRLVKSGDYIWCFKDNKLEYINGQFKLIYNNQEYINENSKLTDDVLKFSIYTIK
jgi:hypothetical protein